MKNYCFQEVDKKKFHTADTKNTVARLFVQINVNLSNSGCLNRTTATESNIYGGTHFCNNSQYLFS